MSQEFAHPTEKYDVSQYGENLDAQQARQLVLNGYPQNAFICNGNNTQGTGKCQCPIMLASVNGKVPAYFRSEQNSQHTCNIIKREAAQADENKRQEKKYKTGSAELAFFRETVAEGESTQKTKNVTKANGKGSSGKHRTVAGNTNATQVRSKKIKTLRAVVSNRNTTQRLDNGKQVSLNDLIFPIEKAKDNVPLPDPRLMPIWESRVSIYANEYMDRMGNNYTLYTFFFPNKDIEGRRISMRLNEGQIKDLLTNFKNYLSQKKSENQPGITHWLHLYTTIIPTTSENQYEDIMTDSKGAHINHEIYLKP